MTFTEPARIRTSIVSSTADQRTSKLVPVTFTTKGPASTLQAARGRWNDVQVRRAFLQPQPGAVRALGDHGQPPAARQRDPRPVGEPQVRAVAALRHECSPPARRRCP